jgi:transposase
MDMEQMATIGLDIAKSVFQVHGIGKNGSVVVQRRLRRSQVLGFFSKQSPCVVGIEACASSHFWAREIGALGHDVRLMPAAYVKPYVKRQKNDAADAEAICEAVTRPTMRFVPVKSPEQQSIMVLHKTRQMVMRQRTKLANTIRAHMAEIGIVAPIGRKGLEQILEIIGQDEDDRLPDTSRSCLRMLADQFFMVKTHILELDRAIVADVRRNESAKRLMAIPGVGPLLASAMVAAVPDPGMFKSGRNLAAWIGLVPRQNSSGGKERLGGITKQGNRYLRQLLFVGAMAVIRYAERHGTRRPWLVRLMARRQTKVAAAALANKTARMIWAIMTTGERYREPLPQAA